VTPLIVTVLLFLPGAAAGGVELPAAAVAPDCTAIFRGALPTAIVAITRRPARSTTETSLVPSLVTYAVRPSELEVLQCGALPTATVPATALVEGSRIASSPGPCTTARAQRPSGVKG